MDLQIEQDAPEDVVQFVRHIEENFSVSDSSVTVTTVQKEDWEPLPGEDIPTRRSVTYADWGVRIVVEPADISLEDTVHTLSESFYSEFVINTNYTNDKEIFFIFEDLS